MLQAPQKATKFPYICSSPSNSLRERHNYYGKSWVAPSLVLRQSLYQTPSTLPYQLCVLEAIFREMAPPSVLWRAALGYIRSYFYLIQHQLDFDIALEKKLISSITDFNELLYFLQFFGDIGDDIVTPRYQYGELRLSHLNLYTKFYLLEAYYHKVMGQYGPYLTRVVTPFLFVFATVLVALAAMQVILAVEQIGGSNGTTWQMFISVSQGFSVVCLVLILFSAVCVPGIACFFGLVAMFVGLDN
jgi:hypothetical protein